MDESNFFSLDKLVEFGMGMAVATQMASSMNSSLSQMKVPGVQNRMSGENGYSEQDALKLYYVAIDGQSSGPYAPSELSKLIEQKKLTNETYVWTPGMDNWDLAQNVAGVLEIVALTPPPLPEV